MASQALSLESIFSTIVLPNVGNDAPPFLQGRGFVFASQFATSLPSELAVQFLDAAVNAIESEAASLPVKISAVRTVKNFYRHLPSSVVGPYAPRIVQKLGPLLTQASEDTLRGLKDGNEAYEQRFGYIFIVCATGKSADEMLALLQARLPNAPAAEIHLAMGEQAKITRLRLEKLLAA